MDKKIIVELLKKKSFWEEKKNKYSSQYNNWVENSWLNNFAFIGAGYLIKKHFLKSDDNLLKGIGYFLVAS